MKAIIEAFEEEPERVLNIDDEYGDGFELEVPDAVAILTALKAGQAAADWVDGFVAAWDCPACGEVAGHHNDECELRGLVPAYEEAP